MYRKLALVALIGLMGCAEEKRAKIAVDISKKLNPGCYTVDLFDPYQIEYPTSDVSAEARNFLGVWKNGAWGGKVCHDLYITKVSANGDAVVIDAYGPDRKNGREATVFKRTAKIKDGVLTFYSHGRAPVKYRLVGKYLVGERRDALGKFEITMSREDGLASIPLPPKRPTIDS